MTNIATTLFLLTIALSAPSLSCGNRLQGNRNEAGGASQEGYVDVAREFNKEEMRFLQMSSSMGTDDEAPVVPRVDTPSPSMAPSTTAPTGSSAPSASAAPSPITADPTPAPTPSPTPNSGGTTSTSAPTAASGSGSTPTDAPASLPDVQSSAATSTVSTFAALLAVMTLYFL